MSDSYKGTSLVQYRGFNYNCKKSFLQTREEVFDGNIRYRQQKETVPSPAFDSRASSKKLSTLVTNAKTEVS
jgi:hypothetical protein